jgi:hypothetical protein
MASSAATDDASQMCAWVMSMTTPAGSPRSRTGHEIVAGAPDRTLIIVWPMIAQPPMPPKEPVTTLARP